MVHIANIVVAWFMIDLIAEDALKCEMCLVILYEQMLHSLGCDDSV